MLTVRTVRASFTPRGDDPQRGKGTAEPAEEGGQVVEPNTSVVESLLGEELEVQLQVVAVRPDRVPGLAGGVKILEVAGHRFDDVPVIGYQQVARPPIAGESFLNPHVMGTPSRIRGTLRELRSL